MDVTIYGVRGSIPAPGPSTIRYGGNTVSVGVRLADGTRLVLDAGTGIRNFGKDLMAEGLDEPVHFLLTHRHYDHIIGLPFFEPIYRAGFRLVVYPLRSELPERRRPRAEIFDGIQTPAKLDDLPSTIEFRMAQDEVWEIGSARVRRIDLNHPGGAQGFRIDDGDGGSLSYLTDNELNPPGNLASTPEQQAAFAKGSGLLIADSQYLPEDLPAKRGWGHSTVPEVLALGRAAGPLTQLLFHHDPDRSDADLDAIGEQARRFAESESTRGPVLVAREGMRFRVGADSCVALPDRG
jgi:phosphoribosyl 1,2-cyclic phosphodiesterase